MGQQITQLVVGPGTLWEIGLQCVLLPPSLSPQKERGGGERKKTKERRDGLG